MSDKRLTIKKRLHIIKHRLRGNKMAPAFSALHTFLFTPDETTHSGGHIRSADDLKRTMNMVILALIPVLLFSFFNTGYQHYAAIDAASGAPRVLSLMDNFLTWENFWLGFTLVMPLVIISYAIGLGVEFIFAIIKGHEVEEGYLVTGMLVPLIVPVDTPLWMLAVAVVFGVVIGKEVFGGTGMNILNPALTIRAFLFFAYPTWMSGDKVWVHGAVELSGTPDAISGETILGSLAQNKLLRLQHLGHVFRVYSRIRRGDLCLPYPVGRTLSDLQQNCQLADHGQRRDRFPGDGADL